MFLVVPVAAGVLADLFMGGCACTAAGSAAGVVIDGVKGHSRPWQKTGNSVAIIREAPWPAC